jgi:hypothetical protein
VDRTAVEQQMEREELAWSSYPPLMRELVIRLLTGAASDGKQGPVSVISARYDGLFGYSVGIEGTANVPPGARVVSITCRARPDAAGQLTIGDGDPIPLDPGEGFGINPEGKLADTSIVFTGTARFFVEYVIPSPEVDA